MSAYTDELFPSYSAVEARREWEIEFIKERLGRGEKVDLPVCRVERVSGNNNTVRFGLKRGKLLYLFKYPTHNVEREKHRNVITRARFIKSSLEQAGYRLIPWDFKKGKPPNFWEEGLGEGGTMEEEDDDLYGPSEGPAEDKGKAKSEEADESGDDEPMLESGEEEESSDSDIDIIIDKPATAPKTAVSERQESKAIKIEAPPKQTSAPPQAAAGTVPQLPSQPGTAYPPVRSSTIDVNADPVYPAVGKPISQIDMDADLAESMKPWRLPGADQSDYFNYGFDEFTWEMYRQRQSNIAATLAQQKAETAQFQQMFMPSMSGPAASSGTAGGNSGGSGGAGGVPGAPTGPAAQGGGGMGDMAGMMGMSQEQLMGLMTQMQASGIDPAQMDFPTFMQMAGGMGAGFPGAQQGGAGFGGGGGQQQPGGGGRGQGGRRGGRGW